MSEEKEVICFRVTRETKKKLQDAAKLQDRSISSYVRKALRDSLQLVFAEDKPRGPNPDIDKV